MVVNVCDRDIALDTDMMVSHLGDVTHEGAQRLITAGGPLSWRLHHFLQHRRHIQVPPPCGCHHVHLQPQAVTSEWCTLHVRGLLATVGGHHLPEAGNC